MSRMLIYPADRRCLPLLEFKNALNVEDLYLATPVGTELNSPLFSSRCAYGDDLPRITVIHDKYPTQPVEYVLLFYNLSVSKEDYQRIIDVYLAQGSQIYLSEDMPKDLLSHNVKYMSSTSSDCVDLEKFPFDRIFPISTPTLAIVGAGVNCSKFDLLTALTIFFNKGGYKVMSLSGSELSCFWNIMLLPGFLYENISLENKTLMLNHYLYDMVLREKPDIVMIDVPGGVTAINPYEYKYAGEIAQVITGAIEVDLGIYSVYAHSYSKEFFEILTAQCKYKCGFEPYLFHIANTDFRVDPDSKKTVFRSAKKEFVAEELIKARKTMTERVFSLFDEKTPGQILEQIYSFFTGA